MKVKSAKSFYRDLKRIKSQKVKDNTLKVINDLKNVDSLRENSNIVAITTAPHYYRLKIGQYRIGFKMINGEITLLRILNRKDIYKYFP